MVKLYLSFPLNGRNCDCSVSSQLNPSRGMMGDVLFSEQVVSVFPYALALRDCRILHIAAHNPTIRTKSRFLESMSHGASMSTLYRASAILLKSIWSRSELLRVIILARRRPLCSEQLPTPHELRTRKRTLSWELVLELISLHFEWLNAPSVVAD